MYNGKGHIVYSFSCYMGVSLYSNIHRKQDDLYILDGNIETGNFNSWRCMATDNWTMECSILV